MIEELHLVFYRSREEFESEHRPSWVPYWHGSADANKDVNLLADRFAADNKYRSQTQIHTAEGNPNVLLLKGFLVGYVKTLSSCTVATDDYTNARQALDQAESLATCGLQDDAEQALAATLIAGAKANGPAQDGDLEVYKAWRKYIHQNEARREVTTNSAAAEAQNTRAICRFDSAFYHASKLPRVFSTTSWQISFGPAIMCESDTVVIVYGSRTPFILRPCGIEYRSVGSCYVHNIMFGGAVVEHEFAGLPDVTLRIK